jgi:hypothetical protein
MTLLCDKCGNEMDEFIANEGDEIRIVKTDKNGNLSPVNLINMNKNKYWICKKEGCGRLYRKAL